VVVQDSERALVPVVSEPTGPTPLPEGLMDLARLLAMAAVGRAVETQRRWLDATGVVVGGFAWTVAMLARPAAGLARRSVAVARRQFDLDGWAARGLAEQQHAQEAVVSGVRALIAALAVAVIEEVDVDEVVARVDVDAIAKRIDLDAIVARVDLDAILARINLAGLTEQVIAEMDLGEIVRESSSTMASETVDALRVQGMRVDGLVSRTVDRVLLRPRQRRTGPLLEEPGS
jgi:hypothetical protein